jgi:hypothetical protein
VTFTPLLTSLTAHTALTKYGQNAHQQSGIYACDGEEPEGGIGAMHTSDPWKSPNPVGLKGSALSIACKSRLIVRYTGS